jgi:hypothetical protein
LKSINSYFVCVPSLYCSVVHRDGKIIVLKSEDTDVENNKRLRTRRGRRFFRPRRRFRPSQTQNGDDTTNETSGENYNKEQRPRRARKPRRFAKERQQSDGETTDKENSNNKMRKRRDNRVFCIKVSNLDRTSRIKDLKAELRKRGCNPMFISWRGGANRKCYLHFGKRGGQDTEIAINDMLNSLSDLTLTVQNGETARDVPLKVELIKRQTENRIETTDVTAV